MKNTFMQEYMVEIQSDKGYTLIEVIISLAVSSILLLLLLSTLQFSNSLSGSIERSNRMGQETRNIHLFFQKQILKSQKIYIKNNQVYLQDTDKDDSELYNYYSLNKTKGILYRYKVYEQDLKSIGLGGTSQIADGIEDFSMTLSGNTVHLRIKFQSQNKALDIYTFYTNEVFYAE